jgi:hypothetical protein
MRVKLNPLDKMFSEFIRRKSNGVCERCGQWKGWKELQCAHFHKRGELVTRWDEDNACALCGGCHRYIDSHPVEKVEFFQSRLKEKFDLLAARRRVGKVDLQALIIYYKVKIKEVESESRS